MRRVIIQNSSSAFPQPIRAIYADSYFLRLRGLMFFPNLQMDEGILLVEKNESIINTSIHMLFMNFDITAVWINKNNQVVDVQLARRWRLAYAPKSPAKSILEVHPDHLYDFHVGDQLTITDA